MFFFPSRVPEATLLMVNTVLLCSIANILLLSSSATFIACDDIEFWRKKYWQLSEAMNVIDYAL